MGIKQKSGIWLDHSAAHLIDLNIAKNSCTILSNFTFDTKEEALSRSENLMHNKEQQMHEAYYKKIANKMLVYDYVLIFGPTNAKDELNNFLSKDLHFKDIQIDIETTDKMEENVRYAFVKDYFESH
jgi:hypothetical protein